MNRQASQVKRYERLAKSMQTKTKTKRLVPYRRRQPTRFTGIVRPPNHGVSGYATTGIPGDYNTQINTRIPPVSRFTTPFSNYNVAYAGQPQDAFHTYTEFYNSRGVSLENDTFTGVSNNVAPNTSESFTHAMEDQYTFFPGETQHLDAYLRARAHQEGRGRESTLVRDTQREGGYSGDPTVNNMIQDENVTPQRQHGNVFEPEQAAFVTPSPMTGGMHQFQENGSNNDSTATTPSRPQGRVDQSHFADRRTPSAPLGNNVSVAVHPSMQGPEGAVTPNDGSWTFDITQQPPPLTLTDLPPPAEIPVQEWGPNRLTVKTSQGARYGGAVKMSLHRHI